MTGILEKLGILNQDGKALKELRLEFIRFRKFLENMRQVIRIVEDAKDKLREEYIFDRHYILSLVDRIVEESSMMAFNASVLSPSAGSKIYTLLDDITAFAEEEFLKSDTMRLERFSVPRECGDSDPETVWLHGVLNWFEGPLPGNRTAVVDFLSSVSDEVLANCRKDELVRRSATAFSERILDERISLKLFDIDGTAPPGGELHVSPEHIKCRPFGLLFIGYRDGKPPVESNGNAHETDSWMLFDEDNFSLRINTSDGKIHLETTFFGSTASDFIYLYALDPFDLKSLCPHGSWVLKTERGTMAWMYDIPTAELEKQLIQIGSVLLYQA